MPQDSSFSPERLRTFGAVQLLGSGAARPLPSSDARRLLLYLIVAGSNPVRREQLLDQLWPDAPPPQARRQLRQVLYRLRRDLPPQMQIIGSDALALRSTLPIDYQQFQVLIARGDPADLAAAVGLYSGELAPEISDEWIVTPRVTAHEQFLYALEQLAATAADPLPWLRRLCAEEPLYEPARRALIAHLAQNHRLIDALEEYARLERTLAVELGIAPSAESIELAQRLRSELEQLRRDDSRTFVHPPFVGRSHERRSVIARLKTAAHGRGGLLLLLGEAGIGKTRLAEELATAAQWRGWQIAWGRAEALDQAPPLMPLRAALAAALPIARRQQLARLVSPYSLDMVTRMIDLDREAPVHTLHQEQIAPVIGEVLRGLSRISPLLLILDDVHWAAADLWPLLDQLREPLADMAVLIVLTARDDGLRMQPDAQQAAERWSAADTLLLHLHGLPANELDELAIACAAAIDRADLARLAAASGGNPLLALELLRNGIPNHPAVAVAERLLAGRMHRLSTQARLAAQAAAVLGSNFAYPLWEGMLFAQGMPPAQLAILAGELERAALIVLSDSGYRFAHDTLRAAIYQSIGASDRRTWHRLALHELARGEAPDYALLLHHSEQAALHGAIASNALAAGRQALAAHSYQAARTAYERALHVLPTDDLPARYRATLGLVQAVEALADRAAQATATGALAALAGAIGEAALIAEAALHQAGLDWSIGAFGTAAARAAQGLAAAQDSGDRRLQALLLEIAGRCARDLGDYPAAEAAFSAARSHYEALNDQRGMAWIDGMLGLVAQRRGDFRQAATYQRRAVAAYRSVGDPYHELRAATGLALAHWMLGAYVDAHGEFERILERARASGDGRMLESALANLGALADILGDYARAIELKGESLKRSRRSANQMGISVNLCNLGITAAKLGNYDQAIRAFDEAIELDRANGRRQGEAYALHGRGQALLAAGQLDEARDALTQAYAIRAALGERDLLVATEADLALASLPHDPAAAEQWIAAALSRLHADDRADLREQVHLAAYQVRRHSGTAAEDHLHTAHQAMLAFLAPLPNEARTRLMQADPLHRHLCALLAEQAEIRTVRLVRSDVPLGRKLIPADYVAVRWTIATPADEAIANAAARRRHILARLLNEAAIQGASPTDDDLAAALGVSRRTILRDMAALSTQPARRSTRRRLSQ